MVKVYGAADADEAIRKEWGELLAEHLDTLKVSRKELRHRLAGIGIYVTEQAIGQWTRGETAPRPSLQAAIAHVLNVPTRSLWPLTYRTPAA